MMLPSRVRVIVAKEPVDFRKSYDGLCGVVRGELKEDPQSATLFVFRNRRLDQVKLLWWDGNGYAIWMKRLCRGAFRIASTGEVSVEALVMLLHHAQQQ